MTKDEMRFIRIQWTRYESVKEAIESPIAKRSNGLYQIYGDHVVFGHRSFLYVGKAVDQKLCGRLAQHVQWLEGQEESGISVHLGILVEADCDDKKAELTDDAEALTIYWHSPPYNSQHINSYSGQPLWVHNLGDRGSLLPEYSTCLFKRDPGYKKNFSHEEGVTNETR